MHNVSRIAAIVLVVLATVLALIAFSLGKRRQETATIKPPVAAAAPVQAVVPANSARVVVAAQLLRAGQVIQASSLHEVAVSAAPEGSYDQVEALVGDVPRVDVPEGAVVTSSLLSNPVAMQLRPGERALAVPVDEISGVGFRVQPGDYVDVVLTLKIADPAPTGMGMNKEHSESRLLASRLRVLAYGVRDLPRIGTAPAAPGAKSEQTEPPPKMAVLAVPVDEIDPLVLGAQSGKLSLALRHPGDQGMPSHLLFPLPATVLSPRGDLSAEQRTWLATPENRAFAGVDEAALTGRSKAVSSRPASRAPSPGGLEIIRGSTTASSARATLAVNP